MTIPPLAGLCTYSEAARQGYSVEENVNLFLRYAWIEKRSMEAGLYWLNPTPEWEVKEALSLHLYLDAEHAGLIRRRVSEMRNPPPRMDISPDPNLDAFFSELFSSQDTLEKLVGLYGVLKPALLAAYQEHYAHTNPLVDHPTRRMLHTLIDEEEQAVMWGRQALAAVIESSDDQARAEEWTEHLNAYLQAAGGIMANSAAPADLPAPRASGGFTPDFFPQRDDRFKQRWNFIFPPGEVYQDEDVPDDERTLALMCKRALEMDVPEAMARMIAEAEDEPWDYYVDMCRQLWDEARHAMMGEIYFEHHGIDWREHVALHPGFSIRLNQHMTALEAHAILYTIEQGLMPAKTGKKYEWEISRSALDSLATLFQDYDWADEVLHTQIGRRWLVPKLDNGRNDAVKLGEQKMAESIEVLEQYADRGAQVTWWPTFVSHALGKEPATISASPMADRSGD